MGPGRGGERGIREGGREIGMERNVMGRDGGTSVKIGGHIAQSAGIARCGAASGVRVAEYIENLTSDALFKFHAFPY